MNTKQFVTEQLTVVKNRPLGMKDLTGYDTTDPRYGGAAQQVIKLVNDGYLSCEWDNYGNPSYHLKGEQCPRCKYYMTPNKTVWVCTHCGFAKGV